MKPFESPEGRKGVSFEGHAEIGALAAGLELMIEMTDQGDDNQVVKEAKVLSAFSRDILHVDGRLAQDPRVRAAMGGEESTEPTVVLSMDDYRQLVTANIGLQVAAQAHEDELIRMTAQTTYDEFAEIAAQDGFLERPAA